MPRTPQTPTNTSSESSIDAAAPAHGSLVLASGSAYRRELLERLHQPFTVTPSHVDETPMPDEAPKDLVVRLARDKAMAVAPSHPAGLIIGSDQLAVVPGDHGDEILGKPHQVEVACQQLARLSGREVTFYTSLCVLRVTDGALFEGLDRTVVDFRTLADAEIRAYVAADQPLDCAGAFKSEGLGSSLFNAVHTQDPNALIGLPMIMLCRFLLAAQYPLLNGGPQLGLDT